VRAAWLALLALAACNRSGAEDGRPPIIEVRDAAGDLRLAVFRGAGGPASYRWVEVREGEGRLAGAAAELRGPDPRHGTLAMVTRPDGSLELQGARGRLLDLRRVDGWLRLGDASGIPLARQGPASGEEALVHGPGGQVLVRARRAGGRIVVSDGGGAITAFVTGEVALDRAALALVPALTAGERVVLLLRAGP
jgi:hypothetical protein